MSLVDPIVFEGGHPAVLVRRAAQVIGAHAYRWSSEADLQAALAAVLEPRCATVEREHRLAAADRLDFLLLGTIAVEVKLHGSATALLSQVQRYCDHPSIGACLVVTPSRRLAAGWPETLRGKPVAAVLVRRVGGL